MDGLTPQSRGRRGTMVLVASSETVATAHQALASLGDSALPLVGAVLVGDHRADDSPQLPIPVLGGPGDLAHLHEQMRFGSALLCLEAQHEAEAKRAHRTLAALGVDVRTWPALRDVLRGPVAGGPTGAGDPAMGLLDRPVRELDERPARGLVGGKRILITGAGGSIGSDLARRCMSLGPALLVLMDRSENGLFEIDRELGELWPDAGRQAILHDVVDTASTCRLVRQIKPEVVFHAAAHKHVPMMQDHPGAALSNNLFGTRSIAQASLDAGVRRFVMISTDKAVHPRSVMGASKWLAEQYVRSLASEGATSFRVVRFGNVLGSACSVLPIWRVQLERGGALTVTDPDMTRYFMTIPEAAALVIQAAALEHDGGAAPVYVLDMGDPIRIGDLAERFVRERGLEPRWVDERSTRAIDLEPGQTALRVTGIRPGEKLHEELAHDPTSLTTTRAPGVLMWKGESPDPIWVEKMVEVLEQAQSIDNVRVMIDTIARFVPDLSTQNPNNTKVANAA